MLQGWDKISFLVKFRHSDKLLLGAHASLREDIVRQDCNLPLFVIQAFEVELIEYR